MKLYLEIMGVVIGGAIGSLLRFLLSRTLQAISHYDSFPLGILAVNVLGSLLMGLLAGLLLHRMSVGPFWRALLLIGLLGGFTTFSSFSLDTIVLIESGNWLAGGLNVIMTLLLCFSATAVGLWLIR